jgi:uncharacterized membrane protein
MGKLNRFIRSNSEARTRPSLNLGLAAILLIVAIGTGIVVVLFADWLNILA